MMNRLAQFAGFLALALVGTSVVHADQEKTARAWLQGIGDAARQLSYQGTFVYRRGDHLEAMQIVHRVHDGREQARLYSLSGSAREIIRNADKVTCVFPDDHSVLVDQREARDRFSDLTDSDLAAVSTSYRVSVAGEGRVADRTAKLLSIAPTDGFRYGYHLWVDEKTGLLLKSDVLDQHGRIIEQLMFVKLEAPADVPDQAFKPTVNGRDYTWYNQDEKAPAKVPAKSTWEVSNRPSGFRLTLREVRRIAGSHGPVEHLLYSDGLASVSVYIEPMAPGEGKPFRGLAGLGAMNAYGRMLDHYQITVVGEVPAVTVERFARDIQRKGQ